MIKLKDIVNEIGQSSGAWRVPPGTPDEVVDVMHHVIASIMRRGKTNDPKIHFAMNPANYVRLVNIPEGWLLVRPGRPMVFLLYVTEEKKWYAPDDIMGKIQITPLSDNGLELMIDNWMV